MAEWKLPLGGEGLGEVTHITDMDDDIFAVVPWDEQRETAEEHQARVRRIEDALNDEFAVDRWQNNRTQFARLLCEIAANVSIPADQFSALCASMDLTKAEVDSLFDRAHEVWEHAKATV